MPRHTNEYTKLIKTQRSKCKASTIKRLKDRAIISGWLLLPRSTPLRLFISEFDYEEDFICADDVSIFLDVDVVNQFMALAFKSFSVVVFWWWWKSEKKQQQATSLMALTRHINVGFCCDVKHSWIANKSKLGEMEIKKWKSEAAQNAIRGVIKTALVFTQHQRVSALNHFNWNLSNSQLREFCV